MNRAKKLLMICWWASWLFCGASLSQPKVDMSEGALFIYGGGQLKYDLTMLRQASHQLALDADIGGGYMMRDRFALGLGLTSSWHMLRKPVTGDIGLRFLGTYFFDVGGSIFPYIGLNVTPGYHKTERSFLLRAGIDGGVLVSLSKNASLDFGLRPQVWFKLNRFQHWRFSLPAGFFGVRAFF